MAQRRNVIAADEATAEQAALIVQSADKDRLLRLFYELPFVGLAVTSPSDDFPTLPLISLTKQQQQLG